MTDKKSAILETELVTGHCPSCTKNTILVGLQHSFTDVQIVVKI